jgi:hypothetical protein
MNKILLFILRVRIFGCDRLLLSRIMQGGRGNIFNILRVMIGSIGYSVRRMTPCPVLIDSCVLAG